MHQAWRKACRRDKEIIKNKSAKAGLVFITVYVFATKNVLKIGPEPSEYSRMTAPPQNRQGATQKYVDAAQTAKLIISL